MQHFLGNYQEISSRSFGDLIETVRQGYRLATIPYNEQKDASYLTLPIFQHWLLLVSDGITAELGCGSGFPIAQHIANVWKGTNKKYIGIDLSEEQIDIAKQLLYKENATVTFTVREMMDWCRKQKDNSLSAIISLFSIFHVPRSQHVELFYHIFRILKDGAPLLFTCSAKAYEFFEDRWLGCSKMFWSSFSVEWYEITLSDLGFEFISKSKELKMNNDKVEENYYLLYKKNSKLISNNTTNIIPISNIISPPPSEGSNYTPEMMLLNEDFLK